MHPLFLSLILGLFAVAFILMMCLHSQLANAPGITRRVRNNRQHISLSWTRKKGYFEWLFGPPDVERVLANLPVNLLTLDVSGTAITRLPANLPAGLLRLEARDCKNLEAIDSLPDSLQVLDLWGCEKLSRLPEQLPASLVEMQLAATSIVKLPRLPDSLRSLDARCCSSLIQMSDEWPLFSGYETSEGSAPKVVRFRRDPSRSAVRGGNLHWLNLCKTPVLATLSGNLPVRIRQQLNEHGCAGWRYNKLFQRTEYADGTWN